MTGAQRYRTSSALRCAAVIVGIASRSLAPASAHERSVSYSSWEIDGDRARVSVRVAQLDLSRLVWGAVAPEDHDRAVGAYLSRQLLLFGGDAACAVTDGPRRIDAVPGRVAYEWRLACHTAAQLQIRSELLLDVAPSHLHFARVRLGRSEALERVLSDGERTWLLAGASSPQPGGRQGTSLLGYLALGIGHIVTGYDHLAFLLALLLVQTSLIEVAKVVTGFTVAHSITLGVATLGYLRPEAAAIEALIGLSIALVAIENVWLASGRGRALPWAIAGILACLALGTSRGYGRVPGITLVGLALFSACYFGLLERVARTASLRWTIAFIFGLVHGFGFAAVLLEANLSPARLAQALFGFNLGVEAGQLAAVILIWPGLHFVARPGRERVRAAVIAFGSAAVCGLGLFWFVARAYR